MQRHPWSGIVTIVGSIIVVGAAAFGIGRVVQDAPALEPLYVALVAAMLLAALVAGGRSVWQRVRRDPQITGLRPPIGRVGSELEIAGIALGGSIAQVLVGQRVATVVRHDDTTALVVRVPNGAADGPVVLRLVNGRTVASPMPFVVAVPPGVSGIVPALAPPGAELTLDGAALYVGHTAVRFGEHAADIVRHDGEARLVVYVPAGAPDGPLRVQTPGGSATSAAFTVARPPQLDGVSPLLAPPGAELTLDGAALYVGATAVRFGAQVAEIVRHDDETRLAVRVPADAPDGPLHVATPGGTAQSAPFTVARPPQLDGVSPTLAPPGAEVVLSGAALYVGHTTVRFGAQVAEIVRHADAAELIVRVPAGAPAGPLVVETPGGVAQRGPFTVALTPRISRVRPALAPVHAEVTLSGTALYVGHTTVRFGEQVAQIVRHADETELIVRVPAGAPDGPVMLRTPGGAAQGPLLAIMLPPTVSGIAPPIAPPGFELTITGHALHPNVTDVVFSGGHNATIRRHVDHTTLVVLVPPGALSGPLQLTTPAGVAHSAEFTLAVPPTVSQLQPRRAPVNGAVTIVGVGMYAGWTQVWFAGGQPAPIDTIEQHAGSTAMTVRVPAGARDGPIRLTAPGGTAHTLPFAVALPPGVSGCTPALAPVGAEVTLSGAALYVGDTTVWFAGDQAATIVRHTDATTLVVRVPPGAQDGPVRLQTPGGDARSAPFTVAMPPLVSSLVPALARVGAEVTLTGRALFVGDTTVTFDGDVPAQIVQHAAADSVLVQVPVGAANGPITVRTSWGETTTMPFTVARLPVVSSVAPTLVRAGERVSIDGQALYVGATRVTFAGMHAADRIVHASPTTLDVEVPAGAEDGPIELETPGGTVFTEDVRVAQPPEITALEPALEQVGGQITLTGRALYEGHTTVMFVDDRPATIVRHHDMRTLDVIVPHGALDGPLQVRTPGGVAYSPQFIVAVPPVVSRLEPALAPVHAAVELIGRALFIEATTVWFAGNQPAAILHYDDATTLVVQVPPGARDGPIVVETRWGKAETAPFIVALPPVLRGLQPLLAAVGAALTFDGERLYVGQTIVTFAGGQRAEIEQHAGEARLVARVPAGATDGPVHLQTPGGATYSAPFRVALPPAISTLEPSLAAAGDRVTIEGQALYVHRTEVRFGTEQPAQIARHDGETSLEVVVPADALDGPLQLRTPGGATLSAPFTLARPPALTGVAPALAAVGAAVTLTGQALYVGSLEVTFAGDQRAAIIRHTDATTLVVEVPASAHNGPIEVRTPWGEAHSSLAFAVALSPALNRIEPALANVGDLLAIGGSALYVGATRVLFAGAHEAEIHAHPTPASLEVRVPAGAVDGPIEVHTPGGVARSAPFTVAQPPEVDTIDPSLVPVGGHVTLSGRGLYPGTITITFAGGQPASSAQHDDPGTLTVTVPAGAQDGPISIETPWGIARSPACTIAAPPVLSGPAPALAPVGAVLTLTGQALYVGTTAVTFAGGQRVPIDHHADPTALTVVVPPGARDGVLEVRTPGGVAHSAPFTVAVAPVVSRLSSPLAPAGGRLTLIGRALYVGDTTVTFAGGRTGTITHHAEPTTLEVVVPGDAANGPIEVRTSWGTVYTKAFTVAQPPVLTHLTPTLAAVGARLTLTGQALYAEHTTVTFAGDRLGSITSHPDETTLEVVVPGGAQDGPLQVHTPGGTVQSPPFIVAQPPRIAALTPALARLGATVTLTGHQLYPGATDVRFAGGSVAVITHHVGPTHITVQVPDGAQDGPLQVRTPGGVTSGPTFTVALPPEVGALSPALARVGDTVTLSGRQLYPNETHVLFGGQRAATITHHVTTTQITVRVPDGAQDGPLQVRTPGGTVQSAVFTVAQPPVVTALNPALARIGDTLTITGRHLYRGTVDVLFGGGCIATNVDSVDTTTLRVTVPHGAADGPVSLRTAWGTAACGRFTVALPPIIERLQPSLAPADALVQLVGRALYVAHSTITFGGGAQGQIVEHTGTTHLVVRVPAGSTSGPITVTTPGGTAQSASFSVVAPPQDRAHAAYVWVPGVNDAAGFWIMRTPVTNAQYRRAVAAGACTPPQRVDAYDDPARAQHPVVWVSRAQARQYAVWAGGRLPRDDEWTRAAQGDDGRTWPWGNSPPDATRANAGTLWGTTTPVGQFPAGASPCGALDMAGNVREWVEPNAPGDTTSITRGGAFYCAPEAVMCTARSVTQVEDTHDYNLGFRLAVTPRAPS